MDEFRFGFVCGLGMVTGFAIGVVLISAFEGIRDRIKAWKGRRWIEQQSKIEQKRNKEKQS